jgi:hypothetical protein
MPPPENVGSSSPGVARAESIKLKNKSRNAIDAKAGDSFLRREKFNDRCKSKIPLFTGIGLFPNYDTLFEKLYKTETETE